MRLAAATPTVARVTVREGRDSGGERRKPELPAPPSEPEALKPGLEAGGVVGRRHAQARCARLQQVLGRPPPALGAQRNG